LVVGELEDLVVEGVSVVVEDLVVGELEGVKFIKINIL
jgi:hypothetical protein